MVLLLSSQAFEAEDEFFCSLSYHFDGVLFSIVMVAFFFMFYMVIIVVVIVIAITVAVVFGLGDGVEDNAQDVGSALEESLFGFFCFFRGNESGADDEDDSIHFAGHDGGVGDGEDGGHVQEDVVVFVFDFIQEFLHSFGSQEFGGVWRDGAADEDIHVVVDVFLYDFVEGFSHGDDVGETDVPEAEDFVLHRFSHVAVDEEDFFAVLAHGNGYVGDGGGFAFAGGGGGEADVFQFFAGSRKLKVCADGAVGFGYGGSFVNFCNQLDVFVHFLPPRRLLMSPLRPVSSFFPWSFRLSASGIDPSTGSWRYCSTSSEERILRYMRALATA